MGAVVGWGEAGADAVGNPAEAAAMAGNSAEAAATEVK
jgi:hypothetical protein